MLLQFVNAVTAERNSLPDSLLNSDLMELNQSQLRGNVSREEIRERRREVLQKLKNRDDLFASKTPEKSRPLPVSLVFTALLMVCGGFFIYFLLS